MVLRIILLILTSASLMAQNNYYYVIPNNRIIEIDIALEYRDTIVGIDARQIADRSISYQVLSTFEKLEYLIIDNTLVGDIDELCELKKLKSLQYQDYGKLPECLCDIESIESIAIATDSGYPILNFTCFKNLMAVLVDFRRNTGQMNDFFNQNLWNLRYLEISSDSLSKDQIISLNQYKNLKSLSISTTNNCHYITSLELNDSLKELNLVFDLNDKEIINYLSGFKNLESMTISSSNSIRLDELDLSSLRFLKQVFINVQSSKVSRMQKESLNDRLRKQLPNTLIELYIQDK